MKCRYCKKEFEPTERHKEFCSHQCRYDFYNKKTCLKRRINNLANKFNFEIKNFDKIVNAKMIMFADDNVMRCACDAQNPERFCGSALCISDVVVKGHCECNLFHKKYCSQVIFKTN